MTHDLESIDWSVPWLAPYRHHGQRAEQLVRQGMTVSAALNSLAAAPVRFVPQSDLPQACAYEAYIFAHGQCPTRDGAHDFLNGLCWMVWPQTKRRLNQIHAHDMDRRGIQPTRGAVRDAATLFDENGAVLQAPPELWQALLAKDWLRLFVELRPLWAQAQLVVVGHALLEKLLHPRKGMTAHVYRVPERLTSGVDLDTWLAQDISAERLQVKPFAPLPVLGLPGWTQANEDVAFYTDTAVFRAARPNTHGAPT